MLESTTRWLATTVLLIATGVSAHAASVSLIYTGDNPLNDSGSIQTNVGDVLRFDLIVDFTNEPTIGGAFDLVFDPAALALHDVGLGNICNDPDCQGTWGMYLLEDRIAQWYFGVFSGFQGVGYLGFAEFEVLSDQVYGAVLGFETGPNQGFFSAIDFVSEIPVDYNEMSIAPVPVPAALWLMLSGLAAIAYRRRPWQPMVANC